MKYQKQGMHISDIEVSNWKNAVKGMRYPLNSDFKSDSFIDNHVGFVLGPEDANLIIRLSKAGTDHRKILRMIKVSASVQMPMNWWIHYDTYKVGTVAISRSRMHRLTQRLLTKNDFYVEEWDDENQRTMDVINEYIDCAQTMKEIKDTDKAQYYWRKALDSLPMTYCQERMIDLNYEVLINILGARYKVERLSSEWDFFCQAFLDYCPQLKEIYEAVKSKRTMTTDEFNKMSKKG